MITGLFTLFGIIIGALLTWLMSYQKEKRDRKDKYFFALLEKRFEVNQDAYNNAEKLKSVVHAVDEKKMKVVEEALVWFNENNLYLEPEIREKLRKMIHEVSWYDVSLADFRDTRKTKGVEAEETKEKRKELENTFNEIMQGFQTKIQKNIDDLYYKYLK